MFILCNISIVHYPKRTWYWLEFFRILHLYYKVLQVLETEELHLKWNKLLIGFSTGIIAGALISQAAKKKTISSDVALGLAKKAFKENGPIDGSWIHMNPESIKRYDLSYQIYRGGITRTVNNEVEQYEFLVDAMTGTIIEVNPL